MKAHRLQKKADESKREQKTVLGIDSGVSFKDMISGDETVDVAKSRAKEAFKRLLGCL